MRYEKTYTDEEKISYFQAIYNNSDSTVGQKRNAKRRLNKLMGITKPKYSNLDKLNYYYEIKDNPNSSKSQVRIAKRKIKKFENDPTVANYMNSKFAGVPGYEIIGDESYLLSEMKMLNNEFDSAMSSLEKTSGRDDFKYYNDTAAAIRKRLNLFQIAYNKLIGAPEDYDSFIPQKKYIKSKKLNYPGSNDLKPSVVDEKGIKSYDSRGYQYEVRIKGDNGDSVATLSFDKDKKAAEQKYTELTSDAIDKYAICKYKVYIVQVCDSLGVIKEKKVKSKVYDNYGYMIDEHGKKININYDKYEDIHARNIKYLDYEEYDEIITIVSYD